MQVSYVENKKCGEALTEELIWELPQSLLNWYGFKPNGRILYIGEFDTYAAVLERQALQMVYIDCEQLKEAKWKNNFKAYFDYVVCVETLETYLDPQELLIIIRELLNQDGIFLLGMNNRLGLRYFCGDRDPYTGCNFDSIENYRKAYAKEEDVFCGRMYSKEELRQMLLSAGWRKDHIQFYSVLSDLHNPAFISAEDHVFNEDLAHRVSPTYNYPDTVFMEEEPLYQSLIENNMFHRMANAYLIECSVNGDLSDISHVTSSMERGKEDALLTVIHKSGTVEKKAVYQEGNKKLVKLVENGEDLKAHGISVVDMRLEDGVCKMPYINAETGQLYLKKLLQTDKNMFLEKLDYFRNLILQSSEAVRIDKGDGEGVILRKGYLDLVPLNSFYIDGEFVFFDQEFCENDYPANVLLYRMIVTLYGKDIELRRILPLEELYERYGINKYIVKWSKMAGDFFGKLLKKEELCIYNKKFKRDLEVINLNRQRINYSEMDYQRIFVDIFEGIEERKLILFGSGIFAQRFIKMYGKEYSIFAIVDNNEIRWGSELAGNRIQPPYVLKGVEEGCKVIICTENYIPIIRQLNDLGIYNYSVFNPKRIYECRKPVIMQKDIERLMPAKKYHIGYVAGVFDMFHLGHVNLLRRAKEQCDYLIVGVVSDEGVYLQKKKYPIIPCEDRMEVLRSCRYADQVEVLPVDHSTIKEAYARFHFDCMFSGNDHENAIGWIRAKEYLRKNGADLVYFNYTEKVSSTKLRECMGKRKQMDEGL
ncbi:MAG: adenylyltransferase/cytidyltransferase family protein [Ruminococcus flavefaciens]|nr:adenylyltransferase/cytidyltransferase family protein [Ruminococcus flavefaciens]